LLTFGIAAWSSNIRPHPGRTSCDPTRLHMSGHTLHKRSVVYRCFYSD
jgi:hypothetical protein